eukprot:TRINITY_DN4568_c0_g1_i2.p1 TRINITY_DN4568_c0_g1~~TRINITY_DN4568_c0_g1_i2.p1  ORF type:complete len:285 (+),score=39.80 TRINITY_DN4568_c0_g1_i2:955-1809(+)
MDPMDVQITPSFVKDTQGVPRGQCKQCSCDLYTPGQYSSRCEQCKHPPTEHQHVMDPSENSQVGQQPAFSMSPQPQHSDSASHSEEGGTGAPNSNQLFDPKERPINFYNRHEPYYEFTNFAEGYPFELLGVQWLTSEHYFQAMKFTDSTLQEKVRRLAAPREAFQFTREPQYSQYVRRDWAYVKMDEMRSALFAKFSSHEKLKQLLLDSYPHQLVEHTSNDRFWGDGGDGTGQNMLGALLMELRLQLLQTAKPSDASSVTQLDNSGSCLSFHEHTDEKEHLLDM